MKQSSNKLTESDIKFLMCILEKGNITDTEISKQINISKSTISRIRKKLEKNLISEYIPIIDLHRVGIQVFLALSFQWGAFNNEKLTEKIFSELKQDPHVIFLANGEGSIASTIVFMAFQNLENYHVYLRDFRKKYGKNASQINTLLLPSTEIIKNDFTEIIKKMIENGGIP